MKTFPWKRILISCLLATFLEVAILLFLSLSCPKTLSLTGVSSGTNSILFTAGGASSREIEIDLPEFHGPVPVQIYARTFHTKFEFRPYFRGMLTKQKSILPLSEEGLLEVSLHLPYKRVEDIRATLNPRRIQPLSPVRIFLFAALFAWILIPGKRRLLSQEESEGALLCLAPPSPEVLRLRKKALLLALLASLLVLGFSYARRQEKDIPFRPVSSVPYERMNPYQQQGISLLHGRLSLLLPASKELKEKVNPYDPTNRPRAIFYWDRAYKDGKYYSYFGFLPQLFLLPFLFFGILPSAVFLSYVYAVLVLLAFYALLRNLSSLLPDSHGILRFPFYYGSLILMSLLPFAVQYADFYHHPYLLGMALFASLTALSLPLLKGEMLSGLRFAGIGLLLGSTLLLRPTLSLLCFSFFFLPYLSYLMKRSPKERLTILALVLLPLVSQALFVGILNTLRFSSPFCFGEKYQLTIADVSAYRLRYSALLPALSSTFLQTPIFTKTLPFLHFSFAQRNFGSWIYIGVSIGFLCFPLFWYALRLPFLSLRLRDRILLILPVLSILFLSFFTFLKAGSLLRYQMDLSLPLSFLSLLGILTLSSKKRRRQTVCLLLLFMGNLLLTVLLLHAPMGS